MLNIQGIPVKTPTDLSEKQALFVITFDYGARRMAGHAWDCAVRQSLTRVIEHALSPKCEDIGLRMALANSQYITVEVIDTGANNINELLAQKYEFIYKNKCYAPLGHNALTGISDRIERVYAKRLLRRILSEVDAGAAFPRTVAPASTHAGAGVRHVYAYDKNGALVCGYESLKAAAEQTGLSASGISMCCGGKLKTSGGLKWSYMKK